jgi:hypothetical protein
MYLELYEGMLWFHTDVYKWTATIKTKYLEDLNLLQYLNNVPLVAMLDQSNHKLIKFAESIDFKYEQPFNLLEFDFYYYERWLVMDNNDTVRFENEYDQITFNTVNTRKKHFPKNILFVFKATIVNIYFLNQAIEDYNINHNTKYKGKFVILKIFDRQRKLPPICYNYYIKNND